MANTDPRQVFVDSKKRLSDKVQSNISSLGALARQAVKGSRCSEMLTQSARAFALQEHSIHNSEQNMDRMHQIATNIEFQVDSIRKNAHELPTINAQLERISR